MSPPLRLDRTAQGIFGAEGQIDDSDPAAAAAFDATTESVSVSFGATRRGGGGSGAAKKRRGSAAAASGGGGGGDDDEGLGEVEMTFLVRIGCLDHSMVTDDDDGLGEVEMTFVVRIGCLTTLW